MENLRNIDGIEYADCIVAMIPTKYSKERQHTVPFVDLVGDNRLRQQNPPYFGSSRTISYHLYILSNEKIENGDWFLCTYSGNISNELSGFEKKECCRKIIATTDLSCSRKMYHKHGSITEYLPKPCEKFIQEFVEEYNNGNLIKSVLVEYESGEPVENPENETISTLLLQKKESWNREEVEDLIHKFDRNSGGPDREWTKQWLKENLK